MRAIHSVIPVTVLLAAAFSAPGRAATDNSSSLEVLTRRVGYADLDLRHTQGVATLYARIRTAANEVCMNPDYRVVESIQRASQCRQQAIGQAVEDVHSRELTSLHKAAAGLAGSASTR